MNKGTKRKRVDESDNQTTAPTEAPRNKKAHRTRLALQEDFIIQEKQIKSGVYVSRQKRIVQCTTCSFVHMAATKHMCHSNTNQETDAHATDTQIVLKKQYRRVNIELLQNIAAAKGGKCVSAAYINMSTHLEWQCMNGHNWKAVPSSILHAASWCPTCGGSRREDIVRQIAETIFGLPFPKVRPRWLINDVSGHLLELDCFNEELGLAIEVNGAQHSRHVPHFHKSVDEFTRLQVTDALKPVLCLSNHVALVVIPYTVSILGLQAFLVDQCRKKKFPLPTNIPNINVLELKGYHQLLLERCQTYAKTRGGVCLSTSYISSNVPMAWKCAENHTWERSSVQCVTMGSWCTRCVKPSRIGLDGFKAIANSKGGLCLETMSKSAMEPILFQCASGHQWKATYNSVQQGSWCKICSHEAKRNKPRNKPTIEQIKQIAIDHGGRCYTDVYVNNYTMVSLKCANAHTWHTRAANIINGSWCRTCSNKQTASNRTRQLIVTK